ncbi:MAG: peptidylprolyl isomerase [Victivallaceae bacterium]|nr:peptidylprolyl isomerase [Victivallaceae bacterium]
MIKQIFYLQLMLTFSINLQLSAVTITQPDRVKLKKSRELTKQSLKKDKASNVDSILASVNGTPVSLSDVLYESRRTEARLGMVYSGQKLYDEVMKFRKQILNDIITRKLVMVEYKKRKFEIPKQYTETLLDELMESYGCESREELGERARKAGTSLAELKRKTKEKVIIQVMINSFYFNHVNVTPRELFEYYQKNIADFSSPAQFRLQLFFLRKDKKDLPKLLKSISNDLKSNNQKIFTSLVVLHSDGPNATQGGDVGWIQQKRLRPEFATALKGKKAGDIVGPVKTDEGIYFLCLAELKAGKTSSFRQVLPGLREKIIQKRRHEAFNSYVADLKKNAVIRYYY